MDFSKVKKWVIPEGNVTAVKDSSDNILWAAPVIEVKFCNYTGAPGMSNNASFFMPYISIDQGQNWSFPLEWDDSNPCRINSYSDRIYIRLADISTDTYGETDERDYESYIIASGSGLSDINNEVYDTTIHGTGTTWDELKIKILNTTPTIFEEKTIYGGDNIYEIDLSKYTINQMMGHPLYTGNYDPLYIFFGNDRGYTENPSWSLQPSYSISSDQNENITSSILVTDYANVGWTISCKYNWLYNGSERTTTISGNGSESTGYWVCAPENPFSTTRTVDIVLSSSETGEVFSTCSIIQSANDSGSSGSPGTNPPQEVEFEIDPEVLILESDGLPKEIKVTSSENWHSTWEQLSADWYINIHPSSGGSGEYNLKVSASVPNPKGGNVQSWEITFISESGKTKTCKVYQITNG